MFTAKEIECLKWYTYIRYDPDSAKVTYVGEGKKNRVFCHEDPRKPTTVLSDQGFILRHGLSQVLAKDLEGALIDILRFLGEDELANRKRGRGSRKRGLWNYRGHNCSHTEYQDWGPLASNATDDDFEFTPKEIKSLKESYIYFLYDSSNNNLIDIGIGEGNKVLEHLRETETRLGYPLCDFILRHGLSYCDANEIRCALIDLFIFLNRYTVAGHERCPSSLKRGLWDFHGHQPSNNWGSPASAFR
jgi:hypothetical protein